MKKIFFFIICGFVTSQGIASNFHPKEICEPTILPTFQKIETLVQDVENERLKLGRVGINLPKITFDKNLMTAWDDLKNNKSTSESVILRSFLDSDKKISKIFGLLSLKQNSDKKINISKSYDYINILSKHAANSIHNFNNQGEKKRFNYAPMHAGISSGGSLIDICNIIVEEEEKDYKTHLYLIEFQKFLCLIENNKKIIMELSDYSEKTFLNKREFSDKIMQESLYAQILWETYTFKTSLALEIESQLLDLQQSISVNLLHLFSCFHKDFKHFRELVPVIEFEIFNFKYPK